MEENMMNEIPTTEVRVEGFSMMKVLGASFLTGGAAALGDIVVKALAMKIANKIISKREMKKLNNEEVENDSEENLVSE